MSFRTERVAGAPEALARLEALAYGPRPYVFRGTGRVHHRLVPTYQRLTTLPHEAWMRTIDDLVSAFRVGLAAIGQVPFESDDRHDWLEYARHHGVPTPCLDFTHSPYVALFFAFTNLKSERRAAQGEEVVVWALDVAALAQAWSERRPDPSRPDGAAAARERFLHPPMPLFSQGYPDDLLQLLPLPSKFNLRMQRQQGLLLYDTVDYAKLGVEGLEGLAAAHREPDAEETPTLLKLHIDSRCAGEVLGRLELMGVTGGRLLMDAYGVAMDVANSRLYRPRTSYLRDVSFS